MKTYPSGKTVAALLFGLGALASMAHATESELDAALVTQALSDAINIQDPDNSTIVYPASFFAPYNPNSVSDMLDRIPGVSLSGGGGGGRGLGTGGDLLINGQRLAGKDNSPRAQLDRIAAREVERIEIIRGTSADLDVRGASQVVNVVLTDAHTRSSTSVELVTRHNHGGQVDAGGSLTHSRQVGDFQAMVNLQSRPNYENRISRETRYAPDGNVLGTVRESNVRDQTPLQLSSNMGYRFGDHRLQLNALLRDSSFDREVQRSFVDFRNGETQERLEREDTGYVFENWEVGGDYEYNLGSGRRFQTLFIVNDQTRDYVRERFALDESAGDSNKTLFIDSNQRTRELISQNSFSFPMGSSQDLRVGFERADTRLDSSMLIGNLAGSEAPSERYGGLPPRPDLSNAGTTVQELRYEGFAFHNWSLNDRMSLETSLVYETSEISQTGEVLNARNFDFIRPAVDYRFDVTNSFQIRATIERNISQLSFANFAATANTQDRDRDADAGNPSLVPEKETRYELQFEYRLPDDNGVVNTRFFLRDIDDYIGRIDATTDPARAISAVGNVGSGLRWGVYNNASTRLTALGLSDAIVSAELNLFDSTIQDPFLGVDRRFNSRGRASLGFRHDVVALGLNYGIDYTHHFHGGQYDVDITTITRNDNQPALNLFVSKVLFDDFTFRLESDNTLGQSRCMERQRFDGTTISGTLASVEDSCSSSYRRLTLRMQTTF